MPESGTPRRPYDDPYWEVVVHTNPTNCHEGKDDDVNAECKRICRTLGRCMLSYPLSTDLRRALENTGATGDQVYTPVLLHHAYWDWNC